MKVRIIKTSAGYIAQAFFDPFYMGEDHWYSIGGGEYWSEPSYIYQQAAKSRNARVTRISRKATQTFCARKARCATKT